MAWCSAVSNGNVYIGFDQLFKGCVLIQHDVAIDCSSVVPGWSPVLEWKVCTTSLNTFRREWRLECARVRCERKVWIELISVKRTGRERDAVSALGAR